ncbi:hypothetical protein AAC978_08050 [Desulfitobacterium sp. THU1]|uniref:hypothetical protein n=1 Tax=Desulfitobacterium sp. THU1 TaxID=3138072 RepID=UPI00311D7769
MTVNCRKATDPVQIGSRTYNQYAVKMREADLWPLTSGICIGKQGGTTVILARP